MAHAVETMFSVRETPWHGLGQVIADAPGIAAGLQLAGLDWDVQCSPVEYAGRLYPGLGQIVTRGGVPLGCVGPDWKPLQNREAFRWFEPWVDAGAVQLETAGSLHGGRVVWVMARLNTAEEGIGDNDPVRPYLLLSNSHDGRSAVRVGFTPIRVVCANTLGGAHRDNRSALLRVRHTAGMHTSLRLIRDTVDLLSAEFRATADQYRALARRAISRSDLRRYVTQVIAADPERTTKQEDKKIDEASAFAQIGRGNAGRPLTLWTAYNGVTEYLSYIAGRTADTRLDSLWYGAGKKMNDYALAAAVALAV